MANHSASDRLRTAREKAGYESAAAAAEAHGWSPTTYYGHENGSRGMKPAVAERYAKAFRVDPAWLLYGRSGDNAGAGPKEGDSNALRKVPLVGEVQAGQWSELPDMEAVETYVSAYVPEYDRADLFAVTVRGRSMDRHYPEGTILIVCPVAQAGVRVGAHVIVRRTRGGLAETTVKEVQPAPDGVMLHPRSTDENFKAIYLRKGPPEAQEGVEIIGVVVRAQIPGPALHGQLLEF